MERPWKNGKFYVDSPIQELYRSGAISTGKLRLGRRRHVRARRRTAVASSPSPTLPPRTDIADCLFDDLDVDGAPDSGSTVAVSQTEVVSDLIRELKDHPGIGDTRHIRRLDTEYGNVVTELRRKCPTVADIDAVDPSGLERSGLSGQCKLGCRVVHDRIELLRLGRTLYGFDPKDSKARRLRWELDPTEYQADFEAAIASSYLPALLRGKLASISYARKVIDGGPRVREAPTELVQSRIEADLAALYHSWDYPQQMMARACAVKHVSNAVRGALRSMGVVAAKSTERDRRRKSHADGSHEANLVRFLCHHAEASHPLVFLRGDNYQRLYGKAASSSHRDPTVDRAVVLYTSALKVRRATHTPTWLQAMTGCSCNYR